MGRPKEHDERTRTALLAAAERLVVEGVDEINLFTYPLILGQGMRLFPETGPDKALELVASRSTAGGVIIQAYRPTGRPQYRTATMESTEARK